MLAFYYRTDASPYTIYVLDVKDDTDKSFEEAIEKNIYPWPEADVVVMDGDKIVRHFYPGEDE